MYIYLRVDVPLHRGTDRIVSKYVLVTWQGDEGETNGFTSDDEVDMWFGSSSGDSTPREVLSSSSSKLQRAITAHVHGSDIYRVFPHHVGARLAHRLGLNRLLTLLLFACFLQVHFFASSLSEISEESIRDRVRRAVDNDCMLLRVVGCGCLWMHFCRCSNAVVDQVCIQASGDAQPAICLEVPFDATVGVLRRQISVHIGIPESRQRIVWIRQMEGAARSRCC